MQLLQELGFAISHHKTVNPSTQVVCLGILIDTVASTISVPPEKLHEIKVLIDNWSTKNSTQKPVAVAFRIYFIHKQVCQKL